MFDDSATRNGQWFSCRFAILWWRWLMSLDMPWETRFRATHRFLHEKTLNFLSTKWFQLSLRYPKGSDYSLYFLLITVDNEFSNLSKKIFWKLLYEYSRLGCLIYKINLMIFSGKLASIIAGVSAIDTNF